uniref:Uncharacterized protein n=1 Tax=Arundo donax TaxID=35708 RepID=A0A0A8ZT05_ARUDO
MKQPITLSTINLCLCLYQTCNAVTSYFLKRF